jgi:hypothetical protein
MAMASILVSHQTIDLTQLGLLLVWLPPRV